jgi:GNAT superfamily N-acetyltransferase
MDDMTIERVFALPGEDVKELVDESAAAGFALVQRLVADWDSGANRFDQPGEALFLARRAGRVIGVCGLNVDPYAARPDVGRVRHVYVLADHRRQGIGWALVLRVVAEARKSFTTLTLRTNTAEGAAFYVAIGFTPTSTLASSTHYLDLEEQTI